MTKHNCIIVAIFGLCLGFVFTGASKVCDLKLCPGPLYYYEEIGCTPIFENATSCCPTRYNCDAWENLPKDKCLVNGRLYQKGEQLNLGESPNPCTFYTCVSSNGFASMEFPCGLRGLDPDYPPNPRDNCWIQESKLNCSQYDEICDDDPVGCIIDGKPYKVNEEFTPSAEPEKLCYCSEGYAGETFLSAPESQKCKIRECEVCFEDTIATKFVKIDVASVNDESFCIWKKPSWCKNMLESTRSIRAHCAPVYAHDASLPVDCNVFSQCPNEDENYVIQRPADNEVSTYVASESERTDTRCRFGELTMGIDEEFTSSNWRGPYRCTCEIPPVPTCRLFLAVADEPSF